jgi:hypothetical protein
LRDGGFPVADVVSRCVPLAGAGQALAAWAEDPGVITRILVEVSGSAEDARTAEASRRLAGHAHA